MTSILVVGANGYIGKRLCRELATDHEVLAVIRGGEPPRGTTPIRFDFSDGWDPGVRPEIILHLATQHEFSSTPPTIANYLRSNVYALENSLELADRSKAQLFLYTSSLAALGTVSSDVVTSSMPSDNPAIYGATKYFGERLVAAYRNRFPALSVRLPGVVGPNPPAGRPWINSVAEKMMANEPVTYFAGTRPFNNLCDLDTVAEFAVHLLSNVRAVERLPETINLAASNPMPLSDALQLMKRRLASRSELREVDGIVRSFFIDIRDVVDGLGFQPHSTKAMLEQFAADLAA